MSVRDELDQAWVEWQAADLYRKWRRSNPGEASKLDAYRAGGARPALGTATGRALVCETAAWLLSASVPPPPVSTKHVAYMQWGNGTLPTDGHTSDYEALFLSQGGITGGVPLSPPALFYTSPQVTPQGTGWDYAIGYDQALANGWMLRSTAGALLTAATGSYLLDPGGQAARVAFADSVISRLATWGADGIFHDDVQGYWPSFQGMFSTNAPKNQITGTAYTQPEWQAAVAGWCQYVGGRIKTLGKTVVFNATMYVPTGNGVAENNGDQVKQMWTSIGGACCTHLCCEFWVFTPQGARRRNGPEWFNQWDGWQSLVAHAHSLNTGFMAVHDTPAVGDAAYSRASALLDYQPGDLFARISGTAQWDPAFAKDMGVPAGVKALSGNEWSRVFPGGVVRVDPSAGMASIPT